MTIKILLLSSTYRRIKQQNYKRLKFNITLYNIKEHNVTVDTNIIVTLVINKFPTQSVILIVSLQFN